MRLIWSSLELTLIVRKISPAVQNHLKRVYLSLSCARIGVYLHLLLNIGGLFMGLTFIGSIIGFLSVPVYSKNEGKRAALFLVAAVFKAATLEPLIDAVIDINTSILVNAVHWTSLAFACFPTAAITTRRLKYLFFGRLLGSGIRILMWLQLASSIFGGSSAIYTFEIYFGLLVSLFFLGYIIFDTQMIIEKADHGDYDYLKHSLDLFIPAGAYEYVKSKRQKRNMQAKQD